MKLLPLAMISGVLLVTLGCSTNSKAPDFPKKWQPMNKVAESTKVIALKVQHTYHITPLDTTVKGVLERWGTEAKMPVVYDSARDFTIFKPLLQIKTEKLEEALAQLSHFYEAQNIAFRVQDGVIIAYDKQNVVPISQRNKTQRNKK